MDSIKEVISQQICSLAHESMSQKGGLLVKEETNASILAEVSGAEMLVERTGPATMWLEVAWEDERVETTKFDFCNMETSWPRCSWEKPVEWGFAEVPKLEEDKLPISESSWEAALTQERGLFTLG